jgi:hypothetical protein
MIDSTSTHTRGVLTDFSLVVVLYEVFTGTRAFDAGGTAELLRLQEQTRPASPSSLANDNDPLVARVILDDRKH